LRDFQEIFNARKRLKEQGLGNLFPPKGKKSPMTNKDEIMAWAESTTENPLAEPQIITKAIGKTPENIPMSTKINLIIIGSASGSTYLDNPPHTPKTLDSFLIVLLTLLYITFLLFIDTIIVPNYQLS